MTPQGIAAKVESELRAKLADMPPVTLERVVFVAKWAILPKKKEVSK